MINDTGDPRRQLLNQVIAEYLQTVEAGQKPDVAELLARHREIAAELEEFLRDHERMRQAAAPPFPFPEDAETLAPSTPFGHERGRTTDGSPNLGSIPYFGDYELLEEIARGGMGVVYRARQVSLNRIVALKMILAGQLASEEDVQRFRHEAQTAAALQHPNIVAIHEVGEHNGQHYFSMDYVEGHSLADWIADGPLPPLQAAEHVETVARAIQFAHERGVLHRDLKPANVLLDRSGQVRVTDFGLARQMTADKGLTATGAVVGTPSYMPPEQASGKRVIGPSADIYSLGAVLYELVTGRPPFRAATPLDTLLQVMEAEPAAPRLLNPAVNRDLETIILKCLRKEPAKRYASAAELADDLGAFREGRPIKARRPGPVERVTRWAQKNRRSLALVAVAAAVSAVAVFAALWGHERYDESRRGRFVLTTPDDRFSIAEVIDDEDRRVLPTFTVPTEQPVALPEGRYRLRLSAIGFLTETYGLEVQRGRQQTFSVSLAERRMWDPMEMPTGNYQLVSIDGRTDILTMVDDRLRRTSGAIAKEIWTRGLNVREQPNLAQFLPKDVDAEQGPERLRFLLPLPSVGPDLDGDGHGDLVFGVQNFPDLVSVSGTDGAIQWWYRNRVGLPADVPEKTTRSGFVLAEPLFLDVDGDGLPDALTGFTCDSRIREFGEKENPNLPEETVVQAVSGKTGSLLWSRRLDDVVIQRPNSGRNSVPFQLTPARWQGKPILIVFAKDRLFSLDPRNGEQVAPSIPVPSNSLGKSNESHPPRLFDPNGNGELAVVALTETTALDPNRREQAAAMKVAVTSAVTGQTLWESKLEGLSDMFRISRVFHEKPPDWPFVADLDGSGRQDVFLPFRDRDRAEYHKDWHGLARFDGRTGKLVWRRRVCRDDDPYESNRALTGFLVGPDLNGDGQREVFVAVTTVDDQLWESNKNWVTSGFPKMYYPNVAALSGANGDLFWHTRVPEGFSEHSNLERPFWWQPGPDGRPAFVVAVSNFYDGSEQKAFAFDAASGKLRQALAGLESVTARDFDGDGLPDLCGYRPKQFNPRGNPGAGQLHVLRASGPEPLRLLGEADIAADCDGDGRRDLVIGDVALSGRSGKRLWRSTELPLPTDKGRAPLHVLTATADLNGDGTPDLLLWQNANVEKKIPPLRAISGKDGRLLWKNNDLEVAYTSGNGIGWSGLLCHCRLVHQGDLNGDGVPDLLFSDEKTDNQTGNRERRLLALSGSHGTLLWQRVIGEHLGDPAYVLFLPVVVQHLVGRAAPVIFTVGLQGPNVSLLALDGSDGRILWEKPIVDASRRHERLPALIVGTQSAEGPTAVVACWSRLDDRESFVGAFDAADGHPLWTWSDGNSQLPAYQPSLTGLAFAHADSSAKRHVCLCLRQRRENSFQGMNLIALNEEGKKVASYPLEGNDSTNYIPSMQRASLLGDGREGLVVRFGKELHGFRDSLTHPLWTWTLPTSDSSTVDVRPATASTPTTIIVECGTTVFGIAAPSGKPRWRCDGPGKVVGLLSDSDDGPATVAYSLNTTTVVREALPTDDAGRCVLPETSPVAGLVPIEGAWQTRSLPWLRQEPLWSNVLAFLFLAELALLWWLLGRKAPLVIGGIALLIGVAISAWMLYRDAAFKEADQHYALTDWYGVLAMTGTGFAVILGITLAIAGLIRLIEAILKRAFRQGSHA
jgi:outer membrane protein assembly factor BamB